MRGSKMKVGLEKTPWDYMAKECEDNGYLLTSKKLGAGGFSKVFLGYATPSKICQNFKLAKDLRIKKHNMVALKIISLRHAPPEYSQKFLYREIRALHATYRHPNVIQLYDMFQVSQRVYLVLELARRGDLLEHINSVSQVKGIPGLTEDDARDLFRQIVSAIKHCHDNRIVHRDLKCENILLDSAGSVKLTDFGFANTFRDKWTLMSTFCGSVAYTAPEILLSQKYNGEMADLWSLGVILYAMVTGRLPHEKQNPKKLVQLLKKEVTFQTPVSEGCRDLVLGLLRWHPHDRLTLEQVSAHAWMTPPSSPPQPKLRATKSATTDERKPIENVPRRATAALGTKARCVFLSDTGTTSACSDATFNEGPLKPSGPGSRSGARSSDGYRRGGHLAPQQSEEPEKGDKGEEESGVPPRLLLRRTADDASNPNRIFFRRPQPTLVTRPFHNLPHFRKPGSGPLQEPSRIRQLVRLATRPTEGRGPRPPASSPPSRAYRRTPTHGF